jgi:predicted DNA-binding protein (MmcQ/YjbR family)
VEDFPFTPETSVFKVLGKLFALTRLDGAPHGQSQVRPGGRDPTPGGARGADHPRVPHEQAALEHGDGGRELPDRLLKELIEDSYDLVVAGLPRAERLRLEDSYDLVVAGLPRAERDRLRMLWS